MAVLLLPIGGLSVDLWRGIAAQRQLQAAAEDAATAGASGIDVGTYRTDGCLVLDPSVAEELAAQNLRQQTVAASLSSATVTVNPQRTSIAVVLTEPVQLTLLKLVEGGRDLMVSASASSSPVGSLTPGGCP
jgi:Flp pilus assembly protein TadG